MFSKIKEQFYDYGRTGLIGLQWDMLKFFFWKGFMIGTVFGVFTALEIIVLID